MGEHDKKCIVSQRYCRIEPPEEENLVFIVGSASQEFRDDISTIINLLKEFNYHGYFATREERESGFDAFCDKICSKIKFSKFCISQVNSPKNTLMNVFPPEEELREKFPEFSISYADIIYPSPNVWYEYGLMQALQKRVFPFARRNSEDLPFDVRFLDFDFYSDLEELKEKLKVKIKVFEQIPSNEYLEVIELDREYFTTMFNNYQNNISGLLDGVNTIIPRIMTILEDVDEGELTKLLQGLEIIIKLSDDLDNPEKSIIAYASVYSTLIALSMRCIEEEKWHFLKKIFEHIIWLQKRQEHVPILTVPQYHQWAGQQNLKKNERDCISYLKDKKDSWKFLNEDEVLNLFMQNNFLMTFYFDRNTNFKSPVTTFLSYYASRIAPILSKIYLHEEIPIIQTLFSNKKTGDIKLKLAHFVFDKLPKNLMAIDGLHYSFGDLPRNLQDKILEFIKMDQAE